MLSMSRFNPSRACPSLPYAWASALAVALVLSGCRANPDRMERRTARPARTWASIETTLSRARGGDPEATDEQRPGGSEIPTVVVSPSVRPAAVPVGALAALTVVAPGSPPRPVEVPWASASATEAAEDSSTEDARPVPIAGRLKAVTPKDATGFPAGLRPGPCCARYAKQCAEFVASSKIEGTLASRAVAAQRLRAMPFGKSAP